MSSLVGIISRINPPDKSGERGDGGGQPLVMEKCRYADDGSAQRADDPSAEQAKQEGALHHQVGKTVWIAHQAQRHAEGQRRRQAQHQFHFEIGIADLGEQNLAENFPAHQQGGQRGGHAHLQQQREQQVLSKAQRWHSLCRAAANSAGLAYVSQSVRAM